MAKCMTTWKAEDGKLFETESEALAHEFASSVIRAFGFSVSAATPEYVILVWLYQNKEGFMDQLNPPLPQDTVEE